MKHFQREKVVLCINAQQVLAGVWHGKTLQHRVTFAQNKTGEQALGEFLQQHPAAQYYLILDIAEEDYQLQLLPHSTGRTKKTLLTRKLGQLYRGLDYKSALYYGREQNQPKRDIYLFVAIRQALTLQPWLQILQTAHCKLVGIYLLPTLSAHWLNSSLVAKQLRNTKTLLLSERLSSGLRQTYFANSRLYMSRLLTYVPDNENAWQNFYHTETEKSRLYLISQRLITADTALDVVSLNLHEQTSLDLSMLAHQLHLPLQTVQDSPELIHMQLLINGAKVANLAPQTMTQPYALKRIKHQLAALSLLVMLISIGLSAHYFNQGLQQSATLQRLTKQIRQNQLVYQTLQQQNHALTPAAPTMKNMVDVAKQIAQLPHSPHHMMQVLSKAFMPMADQALLIKLSALDWSLNLAKTGVSQETAVLHFSLIQPVHEDAENAVLQSYVANLRRHPDVMSVEILPIAEAAKLQKWQGNTAQDVSLANPTPTFRLSVTLQSPKIAGHSHETP